MKLEDLEAALRQLDSLAREEYRVSLADVATRAGDNDEARLLRLGRLLGVILKQPFATAKTLEEPSPYSGAYRSWELGPEAMFHEADTRGSWQYQALEALRSDPEVIQSLGWQPQTVYSLAQDAQFERGFFGYLAVSCRRYLCRDPKLRSEIDRQVQTAKRAGLDLKSVTPETIVASGGLAVGATLVQSIPVLGMMGAPVIAGLIFIIYSIGIDAFCRWARERDLRSAGHGHKEK